MKTGTKEDKRKISKFDSLIERTIQNLCDPRNVTDTREGPDEQEVYTSAILKNGRKVETSLRRKN